MIARASSRHLRYACDSLVKLLKLMWHIVWYVLKVISKILVGARVCVRQSNLAAFKECEKEIVCKKFHAAMKICLVFVSQIAPRATHYSQHSQRPHRVRRTFS